VIFDWVQSRVIEVKNSGDSPEIRSKGKTTGEIFIRADGKSRICVRSFRKSGAS